MTVTIDDLAAKLTAQSKDYFEFMRLVRVTEADVDAYEERAGATLPQPYREAMCQLGVGELPFGELYGPDPEGEYDGLAAAQELGIEGFLPLAPNGCGDYYGLIRDGDAFRPTVHFADHEESYAVKDTGSDIVSFLARHGFNLG